jgi:hypothetical protein
MRHSGVATVVRWATKLLSFCALEFCTLAAMAKGQERPARFVIDTRVVCHVSPGGKTDTGNAIPVGGDVLTGQSAYADGATWYVAQQYSTPNRPCWIYGPYTTESREHRVSSGRYSSEQFALDTESDWVAVLDHIQARRDVDFEEYVGLDNMLGSIIGATPAANGSLLQYRRLQMLDRAAAQASTNASAPVSPLKLAWLRSKFNRNEFGATWFIPPERYWSVYDAGPGASWAEDVAWTAEQAEVPRDECYSECLLELIEKQPMQYWSRLPAGKHVHEALEQGSSLAKSALETACYDNLPPADSISPVPRRMVTEIRRSLTNVHDSGRAEVENYLGAAERKCGKERQ